MLEQQLKKTTKVTGEQNTSTFLRQFKTQMLLLLHRYSYAILPCVLLSFTTLAVSTHAQIVPALTIGLAHQKVQDILDDAKRKADHLLNSAEFAGDRTLSNAALKVSILTENLEFMLHDQLQFTFEEVDRQHQNALSELNAILNGAQGAQKTIVNTADDLTLDLGDIVDRFKIFGQAPLSVSRVDGIYQAYRQLDYTIVIRGNGFGFQGITRKVKTEAFINSEPVGEQHIILNDKHATFLQIPFQLLNKFYFADDVHRVSLYLKLTVESRYNPFGKSSSFTFNLPLMLLPKNAAKLDVTAYREAITFDGGKHYPRYYTFPCVGDGSQSLVKCEKTFSFNDKTRVSVVAPTGGTPHPGFELPGQLLGKKDPLYIELPFLNYYKDDVSLALDHPEVGCQYCATYALHPLGGNEEETFEVNQDTHEITFKAQCNGSVCNLRWQVRYEESGLSRLSQEVATNKTVGFGEAFDVDLPPGTVDWLIEGRLYSGQRISCKKGNCGPFLEQERIEDIGGGRQRLTVTVASPYKAFAPHP